MKTKFKLDTLAQSIGATKTQGGLYYGAIEGLSLRAVIILILKYFNLEIVRLPSEIKLKKRG